MKSIFTDKNIKPTNENLREALGETFEFWMDFVDYTYQNYPAAIEEWNFSSEKFGWGFRIKDPKRVLIYLLPRDRFFKAAFVFGQKATDQILESSISEDIKEELRTAKVYAEGRGIRIDVRQKSSIEDIHQLIKIKIMN